ncbi:MAG: lamin tail domain-containing protein, partial [Verrucomicrobiota bacterium]
PGQPTPLTPANSTTALPGSACTLDPYTHSSGGTNGLAAHAATIWELRESTGDYAAPVFYRESTNDLVRMDIPFEELDFGKTYAWRASYVDARGHPSLASAEYSFTFGSQPSEVILLGIDASTTWKYNITDSFSNQPSGPGDVNWWASTSFDDSGANWQSGSPLIADEGAALPFPILTPINRNGRMAFYYRTTFSFPGSPSGATITLQHVVDDGMVVYINGVEVPEARFNMAAPPIGSTQAATATTGNATLSGTIDIPAGYFVSGLNVIAAEVHQANSSSSDTVFGISLTAAIPFGSGDVVFNEVLADNRSSHEHAGVYPDYVELFNNLFTPVDLAGWSLTDDVLQPLRFVFPSNTIIGPREALLVYADDPQGTNALYTGFGLSAKGQTIALIQGNTVHDSLSFGPQAADGPIGRLSDGESPWGLVESSPLGTNSPAQLGSASNLVINEWMADPNGGDDWFELFNPGMNPVSLAGLYLSDDPADRLTSTVPPLSYIAGGGHTRFDADDGEGGNHVNFRLAGAGDQILLTDTDGISPIDDRSFGLQSEGVSSGRFPDGASVIAAFTNTPSPGAPNYLPSPIWINEALANTPAPPWMDQIELFNPGPADLDLSGWWISDDAGTPDKFIIPPGTIISNGAYWVLDESDFNPTPGLPPSFSLSSLGDEIILTGIDALGHFNGFRSRANFGPSAEYRTFGRVSVLGGTEFWPQLEARIGTSNGLPKTTPVIINEVHYHPPDHLNGVDNFEQEFIELQVHHTQAVDLSDWRLKNTVDFLFPTGSVFEAGAYLLVVGFDPMDASLLASFQSAFAVPPGTAILGPFSPKLPNSEGKVELGRPGTPVEAVTPTLLVDKVAYEDDNLWPIPADGGGSSLQRQQRLVIGNDPGNWIAATPTPGTVNTGQALFEDSDGDGIPDAWETAMNMDPLSALDAEEDEDADGLSNGEEFLAGTRASDAGDTLRHEAEASGDDWIIRFTAKPDRVYRVWIRDQLDASSWNQLASVPAHPAERVVSVVDTAANGLRRYYRLSTP